MITMIIIDHDVDDGKIFNTVLMMANANEDSINPNFHFLSILFDFFVKVQLNNSLKSL